EGLIAPSRTQGNLRLYSDRDIEQLRQVKYLVEDRGLKLAGVQIALDLPKRIRGLRQQSAAWAQQTREGISSKQCSDALAAIRDELDGVLEQLGFIEEKPAERR